VTSIQYWSRGLIRNQFERILNLAEENGALAQIERRLLFLMATLSKGITARLNS